MELSAFHFVAAATVVAAFIAALVSLVSLVNSKEQKTTEFRQAWINSLRTEVARFQSQARYIAGAIHNAQRFDPNCFTRDSKSYETYAENRAEISNAYYLVSLHFKPDDKDFDKLKGKMESVLDQLGRPSKVTFDSINKDLEETTLEVRCLLKKEWERVKRGEDPYKWTRYSTIALSTVLLIIIVGGAFALQNSQFLFSKPSEKTTASPCATSVLVKCQYQNDATPPSDHAEKLPLKAQ